MSFRPVGAFCKISELNPHMKNAKCKAVIITKTEPYFFVNKHKIPHGVMTFTVRDSRTTICNCKLYGCKEKICEYDEKFRIGHIVIILNPLIVLGASEKYMPKSNLGLTLDLNECAGSFVAVDNFHRLPESNGLLDLMHISHKPMSYALRLTDLNGISTVDGPQAADFLVMVVDIKSIRQMKSTSNNLKWLEVLVIDQSTREKATVFSIWHSQWVERATKHWVLKKTVLHLIDVKIVTSHYHDSKILRLGTGTVIYENPLGREAAQLRTFVTAMNSEILKTLLSGCYVNSLPNPEEVCTPMTVKQIYERLEGKMITAETNFTAVLRAMVTKFDIDGYSQILSRKCKKCQRILPRTANCCQSEQCELLALSASFTSETFEYFFNMNIQFGDHTGTLVEARLQSPTAERLFDLTVEDFRELLARKDERLEALKWRFLFNYYEVKIFIKKPSQLRHQASILVLDAKPLNDLQTIADTLAVF